jgi:hypothetical protein
MKYKGIAIACLLLLSQWASAGVVEYRNDDRDDWFNDVGGPEYVSTVDFTGFDDFIPIADQWSHLGVHFFGLIEARGPNSNFFQMTVGALSRNRKKTSSLINQCNGSPLTSLAI